MMLGIFGTRDSVQILMWLSLPAAARSRLFFECGGLIENISLGQIARAQRATAKVMR